MKKALWLELPKYKQDERTKEIEQELASYKRSRFIRARTANRMREERVYHERLKQWLLRPENRWCRVYELLLGRKVPAVECHHYQGRRGMLLLYEPFWIPVSWEGHRWIDEHREQARQLGLICPFGRYNSPMKNHTAEEIPGKAAA